MRTSSKLLTPGLALMSALLALTVLVWPAQALAASWLDGQIVNWNTPGMEVPRAPEKRWGALQSDVCPDEAVSLDTPEGRQVADAGWLQSGEVARGWGMTIIWAQQGVDGMCRPSHSQIFVFAKGKYAGSVSPEIMHSRVDGDGHVVWLGPSAIVVEYIRYAPSDPLCCPSRPKTQLGFRIEDTVAGPVLLVDQRR